MDAAQNKRIIAEVFAHTARGDGRPFVAALAPDVRWTIIGATDWSRTYDGKRDVVGNLLMPLAAQFDGPNTIEPLRIVADGDIIVVEAQGHNRTTSGGAYCNRYCWVIRMADGLMVELTEYADTALMRDVLVAPGPLQTNVGSDGRP